VGIKLYGTYQGSGKPHVWERGLNCQLRNTRLFWWREPSAFIIDGSGQEEDSFSLGVLWKPLIKTLEENTLNTLQYTQQAYNRKFKRVCR